MSAGKIVDNVVVNGSRNVCVSVSSVGSAHSCGVYGKQVVLRHITDEPSGIVQSGWSGINSGWEKQNTVSNYIARERAYIKFQ